MNEFMTTHNFKGRLLILISLLAIPIFAQKVRAQQILPLPKNFDENKVTIYGMGAITPEDFNELSLSPSAQFMVNVKPGKNLSMFFSFNKGAGLTKTEADSFRIESLVFPETSNSSFWGSISFPFTLSHKNKNDEKEKTGISPFVEFVWQKRNATTEEDSNLSFNALTLNTGLTWMWSYYTKQNRFRVILGASYVRLEVPDGSTEVPGGFTNAFRYRRTFANPTLPGKFGGFSIKSAFQLNDVTIDFELKKLRSDNDIDVQGVTGWRYTIRTSFAGEIIAF